METIKKMETCRNFEEIISAIAKARHIKKMIFPCICQRNHIDTSIFAVNGNNAFPVDSRVITGCNKEDFIEIPQSWGWAKQSVNLIYFDENGVCWESPNAFTIRYVSNNKEGHFEIMMNEVSFRMRKKLYPFTKGYFLVNTVESAYEILKDVNPFGYELAKERHLSPTRIMLCPALEILCKAGYAFAEDIADDVEGGAVRRGWQESDPRLSMFDRLVRYDGKNPKEIFKTNKIVYEPLKDVSDLVVWDTVRKLVKKNPDMSKESVVSILEKNFTPNGIRLFYEVLSKKYEEQPVFTVNSLLRYLERVDTYEAIEAEEALTLLRDYLVCCPHIGMQPKTDGNSLKREHDVAARIYRQALEKKSEEGFENAAKKNAVYNYKEDVFFIRAVESQADLNDEATQQHNCVACYAPQIAKGKTAIYVARYKATPQKSLVTVELKGGVIVQKYMKYNTPIKNKAILNFLNRWQQYVNTVNSQRSAAV